MSELPESLDPYDDPEFRLYVTHVRENLIPKIDQSRFTMAMVPTGPTDVKFAIELGLSIMLGKPIILVVRPGTKIPWKLTKIADSVIELPDGWETNEKAQTRVRKAIEGVMKKQLPPKANP